jgi:putative chitinase
MKVTVGELRAMIPTNDAVEAWCEELNRALSTYDIDTPKRIAGFISQCAHESSDFTATEENLNYSQSALERVFGRYFGPGKRDASEYARDPEKIANYVYMDEYRSARGALGNTQPGDGWRFRGGGLKQLTGRNNYEGFAKDYGMAAEEAADWVRTREGALASALWFWSKNNLNLVADTGDVAALTKRINGGDIGLADRQRRYGIAMRALTGDTPPRALIAKTLRVGSHGGAVKQLQRMLGIAADGLFGPVTAKAVKAWQYKKGLVADGVVGPKSLEVFSCQP